MILGAYETSGEELRFMSTLSSLIDLAHMKGVHPMVVLALLSQTLGIVLAHQGEGTTPEEAMDVVRQNIEIGNRRACEHATPVGNC